MYMRRTNAGVHCVTGLTAFKSFKDSSLISQSAFFDKQAKKIDPAENWNKTSANSVQTIAGRTNGGADTPTLAPPFQLAN
jgi:hypothetical protein